MLRKKQQYQRRAAKMQREISCSCSRIAAGRRRLPIPETAFSSAKSMRSKAGAKYRRGDVTTAARIFAADFLQMQQTVPAASTKGVERFMLT
jgi:hypothetical protein